MTRHPHTSPLTLQSNSLLLSQVVVRGPEGDEEMIRLDEGLIVFDAALEARDYWLAVEVLAGQPKTPDTQNRWRSLGAKALEQGVLVVAEMAYAQVGDLPKTRYLRRVRELALAAQKASGKPGIEHWSVKAQLSALSGRFADAESSLLQHGAVEDAIKMHKTLSRYDDAIRVADRYAHPQGSALKRAHFQWLLDTRQEDRAAVTKQREGDSLAAIALYLKGGFPVQAAQCLTSMAAQGQAIDPSLSTSVTQALRKAGLHEAVGDFLSSQRDWMGALAAYQAGACFERALELCRSHFPQQVVDLEDAWGEHLVGNRQWDAAVHHFIEANNIDRAIDAALLAQQWTRAVGFAQRPGVAPARAAEVRLGPDTHTQIYTHTHRSTRTHKSKHT